MAEVFLWIFNLQRWIYGILLGLCVWQLWQFWRAHHRARYTVFNIEREKFLADRNLAFTLVTLCFTLFSAAVLSNLFIAPNLSELFGLPPTPTPTLPTLTPSPTVTPELVLPGQETPTSEASFGPTATRSPVPPGGSGCLFPPATISSPIPGAILAGAVEIRGTANIENFAFYVLEVSTLGDNWLTVITSRPDAAGNPSPIIDGILGVWDTSLLDPGEYALRLTVYDSAGNHPVPCTIPITVQRPSPTATPTPP